MRLAQGTGAAGLLALPYRRDRIVRPLLDCTRADVLAYLESLGQHWREDATNLDTTRLRARVRADLVPLLREINPRFDTALARTLAVLGDEDELLDGMAEGFAAQFAVLRDGEVRVDRSRMATISRPMMRRVLRRLLFEAFPEASRLEFEHVEAVCEGVSADGFARDLPSGLRAFNEYGTLIISRGAEEPEPLAPCLLELPGTVDLGDAGVIAAEPSGPQCPGSDPLTALIDADALRGPLQVTSVRPGDRMRPFGMTGSRKLQDVLTDAKVPARERARIPVVRDGERIVWVAGVRSSEDYRVGPTTERTVYLTWRPHRAEGTTK
jgi:tRNA(Ile)-lysidine synthase